MNETIYSIVIPVYNGSQYLSEAIESSLAQTYPYVEVIVVNDGSTDGGKTEAVALSYGDRIRYFYKRNGGVSSALNVGIRNMKGEWFAWLSHDDLFSPDRAETDIALWENHPEARVIYCRSRKVDYQGRLIKEKEYPIQTVRSPREVLKLGGIGMCSITIHKSCFTWAGLFNENNRMTQDVEMALRLSSRVPFYYNPIPVTTKREHDNRNQHQNVKQMIADRFLLAQFVHRELSVEGFFPGFEEFDEHKKIKAWIFMGNWYRKYGAKEFAEEAYRNALRLETNPLSRFKRSLKITLLKMDKPGLMKMVKRAVFLLKVRKT